jgi:hypothetical protein
VGGYGAEGDRGGNTGLENRIHKNSLRGLRQNENRLRNFLTCIPRWRWTLGTIAVCGQLGGYADAAVWHQSDGNVNVFTQKPL